jgi:hypothetical protein
MFKKRLHFIMHAVDEASVGMANFRVCCVFLFGSSTFSLIMVLCPPISAM